MILCERGRQELRIGDVLVSVQAQFLREELLNVSDGEVNLWELHIDLAYSCADLVLTHRARMISIDARKGFLVFKEELIVDKTDKHHQDLHLEALWGAEVFEAGEHFRTHCIHSDRLLCVDHPRMV